MKFTHEKLVESMRFKDKIRDALLKKPMSFSELVVYFNIGKPQLTNHMTQLKKYGFVKYLESEKKLPKDKRKYYVVRESVTYEQLMTERRTENYKMGWKDIHKIEFSPYATMKHTCDKDHPVGNKHKISAWSGYSSF